MLNLYLFICISIKFQRFSAIVSLNFLLHYITPLYLRCHFPMCWTFWNCRTWSEALFTFKEIFFCSSDWMVFIIFVLLLRPSSKFFTFGIPFSSCKICIWFFFIVYFFLEISYLSIHYKHYLSGQSYNRWFKIDI